MVVCFISVNPVGGRCVRLVEKEQDNSDASFVLKIKYVSALALTLAFLPLEDVVDAFELLSDDEVLPPEFMAYFECVYFGV